jgi:probable FeS assembly SUF system protein SufT
MNRREPTKLERACQATEIPSGLRVTLPAGSLVTVTQLLGGSFTVQTEWGALARIDGADADALGARFAEEARKAAEAASKPVELGAGIDEQVWNVLRTVYDPEIPASIVELGLVYLCYVAALPEGGHLVTIRMTLTAPGCGVGPVLLDDVRRKVAALPGVARVDVELIFDPPWDPSMMSEAAKLQLGFM